MITPEVQVVLDWHAALNDGDAERLASLSTSDVQVGGPRGVGSGVDLLRDWVDRAKVRMEPLRWHADGATVVVLERAQWQTPEGQMGDPQEISSVFRVHDGQVTSVIRYGDLESALDAAGMKSEI